MKLTKSMEYLAKQLASMQSPKTTSQSAINPTIVARLTNIETYKRLQ